MQGYGQIYKIWKRAVVVELLIVLETKSRHSHNLNNARKGSYRKDEHVFSCFLHNLTYSNQFAITFYHKPITIKLKWKKKKKKKKTQFWK